MTATVAEEAGAENDCVQGESLGRFTRVVAGQIAGAVQPVGAGANRRVHVPGGRGVVAWSSKQALMTV